MNKENYNLDVYLEERQLIQAAANKNRLVVFVGAGTSIPSGMPSWSKAVEKIKEHLSDKICACENDFLKIPQYYYNEHGRNNYVELMREIFKYGKNLYTRDIHHKILKFRTKYIITTNYDHLLEQALSEENQVFDVVSHDKDLAYGTADRKIIKIHGDFEHDNFVLKEEDYLRYSHLFRLIETYIRALIAGNVILFLGYSFNDPDLKQIFTWVKEILGSDRPQSYIVEVREDYSVAKTNYFKNFGISILYASKKLNKDFNPNELEKNLDKMISFLQSEPELEYTDKIDTLYQELKPFISMNYVYGEYIKNAFAQCGIMVDFNAQTLMAYQMEENKQDATNVLLLDIYLSLNNANKISDLKKWEKLSQIIKLLGKSRCHEFSIEWIHSKEKSIAINLPSSRDAEIERICIANIKYDIDTLMKLKDDNFGRLSDSKPQFYFQQAFLSYLLCDYIDAYQNLQKATVSCYRNEMHDWYFLALLNRTLVSKIAYKYDLDRKEVEAIRKDADGLDLEQVFQTLPKSGRKCSDYLKDLYTFQIFYRSFQEVYKKSLRTSVHKD